MCPFCWTVRYFFLLFLQVKQDHQVFVQSKFGHPPPPPPPPLAPHLGEPPQGMKKKSDGIE